MSTLQKLNINLKKILATTLVFVMITYYYLYVVSPQLTAWLPLVLIIGIVLSGIILVDFAITNKLTRWHCKYLLFYIAVLGISVIFQWPNVAWLALTSSTLLILNRDEFIKIFFYTSVGFYLLVIALALFGVLPMVYVGFDGNESQRYGFAKYSLGFDGPNQASLSFFPILLSGMYLYGTRRVFTGIALIACITVGILTGSRTGFLLSLAFIPAYRLLLHKHGEHKKSTIAPYLFVIGLLVSCIGAAVLVDNDLANRVMSGRPKLIDQYLQSEYTPSVFGSDEVYNKAQYGTPPVDNFPVYIYARYGIIGFIIFAFVFWQGMRREYSTKMYILFLFIILYGFAEAFFDIAAKNFILPILMVSLFQKGALYEQQNTR